MSDIEFSKAEKDILVAKIQRSFEAELDQELEQFDAEFLLDFFSREVGPYYYNRGLNDARALIQDKIETIIEGFYEIEKPTEFMR